MNTNAVKSPERQTQTQKQTSRHTGEGLATLRTAARKIFSTWKMENMCEDACYLFI